MKDFLKSLVASILGCFIVLGLFFLIMFISLVGMSLTSTENYVLKENTILTLKLDGVLVVFVSLIILTLILSNLSHRYKENRMLLEELELEKELFVVALENSNMVIFTYDDETGKIIFRNKTPK